MLGRKKLSVREEAYDLMPVVTARVAPSIQGASNLYAIPRTSEMRSPVNTYQAKTNSIVPRIPSFRKSPQGTPTGKSSRASFPSIDQLQKLKPLSLMHMASIRPQKKAEMQEIVRKSKYRRSSIVHKAPPEPVQPRATMSTFQVRLHQTKKDYSTNAVSQFNSSMQDDQFFY